MKKFRFVVFSFMLTAFFTGAAVAQQPIEAKVALINTDAFYLENGGIKKIADAYKVLEIEFKVKFTELENMAKRFEALQNEARALQSSTVPVKPEVYQAKLDEAEKLQRDFKFRQEDAKLLYDKREAVVMAPIVEDIGKLIGEYAKQKGFTLVLDSGKLFEARILLFLQDTTEISKDFIQFYNARPVGSATTTPK